MTMAHRVVRSTWATRYGAVAPGGSSTGASKGGRAYMRRIAIRGRGFPLIELMIVIAVIAVLVMIAFPSYTRYTFRARRGEGQELLLRLANAQERYYATYNKYAQDPVNDLKFATNVSANGYYKV